jgi:hypothetical protein
LNFIIFKENFEFENYFRILEDKDIYILCKFRTTNHKLPIETGRWNNIDRINRICTKCDSITIGDEYHYIMECEHFSSFRNRFIVTNLRETPNIPKFKQIMSAYQKQNLEKLCKFIRNINKSFALSVVYTVYMFISILYLYLLLYIYVFSVPLYMVIENKDD